MDAGSFVPGNLPLLLGEVRLPPLIVADATDPISE